jgi:hypothetical protein
VLYTKESKIQLLIEDTMIFIWMALAFCVGFIFGSAFTSLRRENEG